MSDFQWTDAAAVDEVPTDDVVGMQVDGRDIALYKVDGQIYATDNVCTHGHAPCARASSKGTRSSARCTRASSTCAMESRPARR